MDLIRLVARIVLNTTEYSAGLKKAEAEAERSSQKIAKETDAIASSTERANAKMESSTQSVVSARQDLLDNIAEIKAMFKEEVALFEEGAISADEYTEDIKNLKSMYKDATKQLREFDSVMDEGTRGTDRQATSMKNLRESTMLAVAAISMLASETIKAIRGSWAAANKITQSGYYYNVGTGEYARLQEMFRANGGDTDTADTLLESVFQLNKGLASGNADTFIALQRAGISVDAFQSAGSDVERAMMLLSTLQGIGDVNDRRNAAMGLFGDNLGRSLQSLFAKGNVSEMYANASPLSENEISSMSMSTQWFSDVGSRIKNYVGSKYARLFNPTSFGDWASNLGEGIFNMTPYGSVSLVGEVLTGENLHDNIKEAIADAVNDIRDALAGVVNGIIEGSSDRPVEVTVNVNGEEIAKAVEKQSVINGSNASGGGRK